MFEVFCLYFSIKKTCLTSKRSLFQSFYLFLFEITIIQIKKATNKTDNEIFTKIQ